MLYEDYTREIIGLKDTMIMKVEQKADITLNICRCE
jgi:hypothetical protein